MTFAEQCYQAKYIDQLRQAYKTNCDQKINASKISILSTQQNQNSNLLNSPNIDFKYQNEQQPIKKYKKSASSEFYLGLEQPDTYTAKKNLNQISSLNYDILMMNTARKNIDKIKAYNSKQYANKVFGMDKGWNEDDNDNDYNNPAKKKKSTNAKRFSTSNNSSNSTKPATAKLEINRKNQMAKTIFMQGQNDQILRSSQQNDIRQQITQPAAVVATDGDDKNLKVNLSFKNIHQNGDNEGQEAKNPSCDKKISSTSAIKKRSFSPCNQAQNNSSCVTLKSNTKNKYSSLKRNNLRKFTQKKSQSKFGKSNSNVHSRMDEKQRNHRLSLLKVGDPMAQYTSQDDQGQFIQHGLYVKRIHTDPAIVITNNNKLNKATKATAQEKNQNGQKFRRLSQPSSYSSSNIHKPLMKLKHKRSHQNIKQRQQNQYFIQQNIYHYRTESQPIQIKEKSRHVKKITSSDNVTNINAAIKGTKAFDDSKLKLYASSNSCSYKRQQTQPSPYTQTVQIPLNLNNTLLLRQSRTQNKSILIKKKERVRRSDPNPNPNQNSTQSNLLKQDFQMLSAMLKHQSQNVLSCQLHNYLMMSNNNKKHYANSYLNNANKTKQNSSYHQKT